LHSLTRARLLPVPQLRNRIEEAQGVLDCADSSVPMGAHDNDSCSVPTREHDNDSCSVPEAEAEAEAEAAEVATAAPEAKVSTIEIDAAAVVPVVTETKKVSSSNPIKGDVRISSTQAAPQTPAHQHHRGRSSHYP
jgi:hypothetical protein